MSRKELIAQWEGALARALGPEAQEVLTGSDLDWAPGVAVRSDVQAGPMDRTYYPSSLRGCCIGETLGGEPECM